MSHKRKAEAARGNVGNGPGIGTVNKIGEISHALAINRAMLADVNACEVILLWIDRAKWTEKEANWTEKVTAIENGKGWRVIEAAARLAAEAWEMTVEVAAHRENEKMT